MSKPVAIILHPKDWATSDYGKVGRFRYVHVSIGGDVPKKRNGVPTYDGYADVATEEGKANLLRAFKKLKPAVFLWWIHGDFGPRDLRPLKKVSPKTKFVMWFGNHREKVPGNVSNVSDTLDLVLLNSKDKGQFSMYKKAGHKVDCLWDGFQPTDVKLSEVPPIHDCTFGGNSYIALSKKNHKLDFPGGKIRYDFITEVHKHFNLLVRSGYPKQWPFGTLPEVFHPGYTRFLRDGRITLNVNHFPRLRKAYTRRTIRSIFARRCHVTLYIPGMEDDFKNHENIVWFNSIEEGIDLIRYYLEHDSERERIAEEGHRLACEKFTFRERMADFEEIVRRHFGI